MKSVTKEQEFSKAEVEPAMEMVVKALATALPEGSFAEREQAGLELLLAAHREFTERELQAIANELGDEVTVDGKVYRHHQWGTGRYHSLSGPMVVERATYREVGVRNGPTIVPLELAAGLVHHATPALAENLAHGYAEHDLRTHCELLAKAHLVPPPRATAERIAKAIARDADEEVPRIEKILVTSEEVPKGAHGIVIGLDRTSTPMAEELPADKAPEIRRKKPYQRQPRARYEVNWRMAYVATVSVVDETGEALRTVRYAATASDDPQRLTQRIQHQVGSLLGQAPHLLVGIVQDGAPEMWNEMRGILQPLKQSAELTGWHECIDFAHVISRVSDALKLTRQDEPRQLEYWKLQLLNHYHAIDQLEQLLCQAADDLDSHHVEQLMEHLVYIDNNKDRMRYSRLRKVGLPIGSGVTESAAKNVVNMRTKRSGQRWSVPGLRGVLTLRALLKSQRLDSFWSKLSRRYVANVNSLEAAA